MDLIVEEKKKSRRSKNASVGNIELARPVDTEFYNFDEPENDTNILYDTTEDKAQNRRASVRLGNNLFQGRGSFSTGGTVRGGRNSEEIEMNLQIRLMEGRHIEGKNVENLYHLIDRIFGWICECKTI